MFHLFVDRRWQRRGIARRLWETGRVAERAGGHAGAFTVNASNHAVPFYEMLGFVRTAPMQVAQVVYNPMRLELGPSVGPGAGSGATAGDARFVAPA